LSEFVKHCEFARLLIAQEMRDESAINQRSLRWFCIRFNATLDA
jgi:hypothetical protein